MKVVVDTSVWSFAFRRKETTSSDIVSLLKDLISDGRVVLPGAVRQELLSGIRHAEQFEKLRLKLKAFPHDFLETEDHETAAAFSNRCRAAGIQGSAIDLLICAYASRRSMPIFTTDPDFIHYSKYLPIELLRQTPGD